MLFFPSLATTISALPCPLRSPTATPPHPPMDGPLESPKGTVLCSEKYQHLLALRAGDDDISDTISVEIAGCEATCTVAI